MTAGAAVAAAGYAVARLLLSIPDEAVLGRMADPVGRRSWPVHNPATLGALAILGEPFDPDRVRAEWAVLLGNGVETVERRESARVEGPSPAADLEQTYLRIGMRRTHVGGVPADHVALELMALAHCLALLGRAAQSQVVPELALPAAGPAPVELEAVARGLLWDHLDLFVVDVLSDIDDRAQTPPLRALPGLTLGFLDAAAEFVALPVPG